MGDVIGDLNSRRGRVNGMDQRGAARVVTGVRPLATCSGWRAIASLRDSRVANAT